ncbi:MAG: GvpL/GvpF family gas vesicle protein [Candidatus Diapherotrites archaeon]|nr:GvpL/GvpF family gas vesicle protein [Candidatus Diapherotrites archaeon]
METGKRGRYVYCVAKGSGQTSFGKIGLEGNEVYAIPSNGLIAIVHDCKAKAYDSKDEEKVAQYQKIYYLKTKEKEISELSEYLAAPIKE